MKSLNCVVYEYILIKRVTEEVKRMLTAVNINRVFTQFLTLVLSYFIEAARTLLLNIIFKITLLRKSISTVYILLLRQQNCSRTIVLILKL